MFEWCIFFTSLCHYFYFFLIYLFIYLFIFGCIGSLLLHAGFLQLRQAGATLRCSCVSFSSRWLLLLWSMGSRHTGFSTCGSQALEHRLSSCGAQAYLLHGIWDLPGPGIEPVSPAMAGRFLTTAPTGKSHMSLFLKQVSCRQYSGSFF